MTPRQDRILHITTITVGFVVMIAVVLLASVIAF